MSWRKKKKQIRDVKHKAIIIICLMFTAVLGLLVFACFKIFNKGDYYKVESRVENVKNNTISDSNYETAGWLRIQGTDIDLPILYSEDKYEDFPVEIEDFVWTRNSDKKFSELITVTGHNIFNLSAKPKIKSSSFHRFEELMAFVYYDFAKDNQYIQLTWDGKDYIYKIYAAGFVNQTDITFFPEYTSMTKENIELEKEIIRDSSIYDYDVDVNENDKVISLSTCTRFFGIDGNVEFYVSGRLLRDGEKIRHYKVTKNSNYNEIEKILKGDEGNE